MFSVHGRPVFADEITVLEEFKRQLAVKGIEVFSVMKPTAGNVMTICPFHKQGRERKPSFGISLQPDMKCHCFTCGWAGTLDILLSNLLGFTDDNGQAGREWLTQNFITMSVESRKPLDLSSMKRGNKFLEEPKYVSEEYLDSLRYVHPYMYQRGLTDEIIEMFDVGYDCVNQCVTFPVKDLKGNCVFVVTRSVNGKFFHIPVGVSKPVYGANMILEGGYKTAVICESIFNALTCWVYGMPAVALIGTGTESQYQILRQLPVRKYILGMDPDEAGRRATVKLRKALEGVKLVVELDIPENCDLNDLQEKVLELQQFF